MTIKAASSQDMRELADYWRREGQYHDVASAIGDEITAENSRMALATARALDQAADSLADLLNAYWGQGDGEPPPAFIQRAQALLGKSETSEIEAISAGSMK